MSLTASDKIEVIGLGTGPDDLAPARLELIRRAEVIVGGPQAARSVPRGDRPENPPCLAPGSGR